MQTTWSKIWTRVTDSSSYDDNRYAKRGKDNRDIANGRWFQENLIHTDVASQQWQYYVFL